MAKKDTERAVEGTIGAFKQLQQELKKVRDELAELTKQGKTGTKEWTEKAKELAEAQKKVDAVTKAAKGNYAAYNKEQVKSINDLKELIKLKNQERNAMDMSSKEYKKATAELKVLNDQLREAGTSAGDWRANVGNYANSIKDAFSELGTAATGLSGSFGGLNAGMLKLASNPVGAVILALAGAIKFLAEGIKSSEENTKRWNEVMVPVRALLVTIQQYAQQAASKFLDFAENLKKSEGAGKAMQIVLQVLITAFNQTVQRIKNIAEGIQGMMSFLQTSIGKLKEWASGFADTFRPVIEFVGKIRDAFKKELAPVLDWIIEQYNTFANSFVGKFLGLTTIEQLKKSWEDAGKTVEEVTDKTKENEKQVQKLVKAENALSETRIGLLQKQAAIEGEISEYERQYSEARLNKDWDKAQEALNKKKEKEIELAKTNVALASAEYNLIKLKNSLSDSTAKDKEAEGQALANLTRAQNAFKDVLAKSDDAQRAFNKEVEAFTKQKKAEALKESISQLTQELNKLTSSYNAVVSSLKTPLKPEGGDINTSSIDAYYDQINANAQAEYDAYVAMQEAKMAELERFIEAEKAAGNQVLQQETELAKLREEQTNGYAAQYKKMNDTVMKSNQDRAKMQLALQKSEMKGYADLFDSVSGLFEQNTIAYKATATAKALINTYLAATSALAETPGGAIAKGVAMAATLAAGLAQVINIWKTNPRGETSVPSTTSTPSIAEPVMEESRPFTYTRTAQTYDEEDRLNQPLWISVQDINAVQERVRVVEEESSF